MDKITNWYLKLDKQNQDVPKPDKNFKAHGILPNSRIALIGGSGAGTGESFDGLIEDVRFENVLRLPAYLVAQYRAGMSMWIV